MQIDVFHDTVCPWCRIGKAHLKQALAQWSGDPVTVVYHPFFLNPDIPPAGYPFKAYMNAKGGGQVPMEQWFAAPREMGRRVGITFNFEQIQHAPNSARSHQLIALTPPEQEEAMIDALYAAYFEYGRDIGDVEVLLDVAAQLGLDAEVLRPQLTDGDPAAVYAAVAQAQQIGITGVPFFIVNQRMAFSGAQPPEVILDVMQQAIDADSPQKA